MDQRAVFLRIRAVRGCARVRSVERKVKWREMNAVSRETRA